MTTVKWREKPGFGMLHHKEHLKTKILSFVKIKYLLKSNMKYGSIILTCVLQEDYLRAVGSPIKRQKKSIKLPKILNFKL